MVVQLNTDKKYQQANTDNSKATIDNGKSMLYEGTIVLGMGIDFDFGWVISKQCVVGIMFRFMLWVYVCVCLFGMLLCHRQWTAALLRALVHLPA